MFWRGSMALEYCCKSLLYLFRLPMFTACFDANGMQERRDDEDWSEEVGGAADLAGCMPPKKPDRIPPQISEYFCFSSCSKVRRSAEFSINWPRDLCAKGRFSRRLVNEQPFDWEKLPNALSLLLLLMLLLLLHAPSFNCCVL